MKRATSQSSQETKVAKLHRILSDQKWHSTQELVRRVGHTFGGAKFKLVNCGHVIEKRKHPSKKHQWQYQLLDEPKN